MLFISSGGMMQYSRVVRVKYITNVAFAPSCRMDYMTKGWQYAFMVCVLRCPADRKAVNTIARWQRAPSDSFVRRNTDWLQGGQVISTTTASASGVRHV